MSEFAGLGVLILMIAFSVFIFSIGYMFWQLARTTKFSTDRDEAYSLMEILQLNKYALGKGIDIEKEKLKKDIFKSRTKSFKRRLEEEVIDEFFGKEKEKEE